MSLSNHPYRYFTASKEFLTLWGELLRKLAGDRLCQVWAVWDEIAEGWFEDAPMLVQLSSGTLSVNVSCENKLAVGWNDILHTDRPVWFDERQRAAEKMDWWSEDLSWREYTPVKQAFGGVVEEIIPFTDSFGLRGLNFLLSDGVSLRIENIGDEITGQFVPAQKN